MASARACPRTSSRSRQSLPVADLVTPRKACGTSTGNADAGSVMMLSAKREARRCNDSRDREGLATHPVRYPTEILGHDLPIILGLKIVFLVRAVFGGPCDKGGLQSELPRGFQVVVVGCDHHHFLRLEAEQLGRAEIGFGIG